MGVLSNCGQWTLALWAVAGFQIYNLGGGNPVTLAYFIQLVEDGLGTKVFVTPAPPPFLPLSPLFQALCVLNARSPLSSTPMVTTTLYCKKKTIPSFIPRYFVISGKGFIRGPGGYQGGITSQGKSWVPCAFFWG